MSEPALPEMGARTRSLYARGLSIVGIAIVTIGTIQSHLQIGPLLLTAMALALAAWVVRECTPSHWFRTHAALGITMVLFGAFATAATNALGVVPAAVGVLFVISTPRVSGYVGLAAALSGVIVIALGAIPTTVTISSLLAMEAGFLLAAFIGFSRRQARLAEIQARLLAEERLAVREEQARTAVLAERSRIARDIHDVLAHSLGGLVIQLDAVDALLEAGRTDEAHARVREARTLAATGLSDARRAVDALREASDAGDDVEADALIASMDELVAANRSMGGVAEFSVTGAGRAVTDAQATALRRALQEALSNARKHAAGHPVAVSLDFGADRVVLEVRNAADGGNSAPADLARSGGGRGLLGMRERFAELPGGEASAGLRDNEFVVHAETELR